jgi:hypothetical protein
MAGRLSGGIATPRASRDLGFVPVSMGVLALSDVEGTPMMAAPMRAAAAVTASRAVFKFNG